MARGGDFGEFGFERLNDRSGGQIIAAQDCGDGLDIVVIDALPPVGKIRPGFGHECDLGSNGLLDQFP